MSIRLRIEFAKQELDSTQKSTDLQGYIDKFFNDPIGYLWAKFFMKRNWTPNMVSGISIIIGFIGGTLFYPENFFINLTGVLMITWSITLDSADGMVARFTSQQSRLGRMLDGLSTGSWFLSSFCAMAFRLADDFIPFTTYKWGWWILLPVILTFCETQRECMIADYFRNLNLLFMEGKYGHELDNSSDLKRQYRDLPKRPYYLRIYMFFYIIYTILQERASPAVQRLLAGALDEQGRPREDVKKEYLRRIHKYLRVPNLVTVNLRVCMLFAFLLLDQLVWYFPVEIIVFGGIRLFMQYIYGKVADDIVRKFKLKGYEDIPPRRQYHRLVFFLIGAVGLVVMIFQSGLLQMDLETTVISKLPLILPLIVGIWVAIYVVNAVVFRIILGRNSRKVHFSEILRIVACGFTINTVTPVGLAGSEPYKAMELRPYIGGTLAVANTLMFTILYVMSMVFIWFAGAVIYIIYGCPGGCVTTIIAIVVGVLCGAGLVLFMLSKGHGFVIPTLQLLSRLPLVGKHLARCLDKYGEKLQMIDEEIPRFHAKPGAFWSSLLLEFAARLMEALEYYVILVILGCEISYFYSVLILASASFIGNVFFIIPMQLSTRESGFVLPLIWKGLNPGIGVTAMLISRIRDLIFTVFGIALMTIPMKK